MDCKLHKIKFGGQLDILRTSLVVIGATTTDTRTTPRRTRRRCAIPYLPTQQTSPQRGLSTTERVIRKGPQEAPHLPKANLGKRP